MTHKQRKVGEAKSEIIREVPEACSNEAAAVDFLERMRWGESPACPRCGDCEVSKILANDGTRGTRFLWRCHGCKKQFTWRIGTAAEDSRIPARMWVYALWRASTSKKGVAALEIQRQTGLSYKSALYLMHRIRFALGSPNAGDRLGGIIECDETYVGGKIRKKNRETRSTRSRTANKTTVMGVLQRGGEVRLRVLARDVDAAMVGRVLRRFVDPKARLMTDESQLYVRHGKKFAGHDTVNHAAKEYARGDVTTNGIEGAFSLLKRGIYGIWHSVSPAYLPLYVNEVEFRANRNKIEDGERLREAVQAMQGKKLRHYSRRSTSQSLRLG